ncbi:prepilin-type N-terminal cleavage/methylation domain-containing protein [Oleiagrimonas soli]|nr:prepilin-type N-terminal cleavage/methylation domain-containing protein [Oleiagrimonas soli]KGI78563.1 hypothetical protein LF63_0103655 [Oleiagrimonas soli]
MRLRARHARGFTLLEVLAAMVLLSLLLLAVWSGIHSATLSVRSGQRFVERTDAVRSTQDFLRRELAQAVRQPWAADPDGGAIVFTGSPDKLQFVAPLPGYLGKLGPQLQTVELVPEKQGDGYRLQVSFSLLPPDGGKPQPLGKPQVLLTGIQSGQFDFRGFDKLRKPTDWLQRWEDTDRTPALVRLDLKLDKGVWPQLVAPIRVDASAVIGTGGLLRRILRPPGSQP